MEAPAEEVSMGAKDQTHFVKGKRTKRVRPQSPMPFSTIAKNGDKDDGADNKNSSGTTSSAEFEGNHNNNNISSSSSTEEEADMANCLILLAQGQSRDSPKLAEEDGTMMLMKYSDNCNNNNNNNKNNINSSSRKFMEAAAMGANKAGFYVYECKTCNRTFPSFQALGGHRASHKKPKALASMAAIVDQEKKKEEESIFYKNNNNHQHYNSNTLSIQFLNSGSNGGNKNKVHECSICGAEFASGQALGGHMRRHRTPIGTTTPTTSLALNNNRGGLEADQYQDQDHHQSRKKRNVLSLDLDLNLPAPEDDHTDSSSSKFAFESKQQQQPQQQQQQQQQASLVFASAPALVDCHY